MKPWKLAFAAALAAAGPTEAQVGSVLRAQEIDETQGGFTGDLDPGDRFGESIAALGDLDQDGFGELLVGAPGDDDGGPDFGAVWVLFSSSTGAVVSETKISQTEGGFTSTLGNYASFGRQVAGLGDVNGDDVPDAAVASVGRLWVLFLNMDGTVKGEAIVDYADPAFDPPTSASTFKGGGLVGLGDLDADGRGDLAVGAPLDDDGAKDAGAVWIVYLKASGAPKGTRKISQTQGGLGPILARNAHFGGALVRAGDIDGDGRFDLGVQAADLAFGGTYVDLFLDDDESVLGIRVLTYSDFDVGRGSSTYGLGQAYAGIGDIDGDGTPDIALGAVGWSLPPAPTSMTTGAIALSFMKSDGDLSRRLLVSHELNGMAPLPDVAGFGSAIASLGDLDGDGGIELAVGAYSDDISRGAVWILSLAASAVSNGSGANPLTLSQDAYPRIGATWNATLDCSGHAAGFALLTFFDRPSSGLFLRAGEVLVDVVSGTRLATLALPHGAAPVVFSAKVPYDSALVNLQVYAQGLFTGAPGPRLGNAIHLLVGK